LEASLAATTGVDCAEDAIRLVLAGADAVMVASALYRHGIGVLRTLVDGMSDWLAAKEFGALEQVKGMLSSRRCPNPEALVRADFAKAITSYASGAGT
jgi:dihydroorotate dehydrogenase (fumarate)